MLLNKLDLHIWDIILKMLWIIGIEEENFLVKNRLKTGHR